MADDIVIELDAPVRGLSQALAFKNQPPLTSAYLKNYRVKGTEEERARGGQRPGTTKWSDTDLTDPITGMCQVVTTYITPAS